MRLPTRALVSGAVTIALGIPAFDIFTVTAAHAATGEPARPPGPQTHADLTKAMQGEAFANVSYRLYAEQARREGMSSVARTFDRAAGTELNEHFTEAADMSGLVRDDPTNLHTAMTGENYEATEMYPRFARQARSDGDTNAAERFTEIAHDEGTHRDAFGTALHAVQNHRRTIPAAPAVHPVQVPAGRPEVHAKRTLDNLDAAMHGEAMAYAKYTLWGRAAHKRNSGVADLFHGSGEVERQEHFAEQARLAGLVGSTRANLNKAIAGEHYESTTMYPGFAKRARASGDTQAARLFDHNATDEASHARAFEHERDRLR